jgi:hypothetical protein
MVNIRDSHLFRPHSSLPMAFDAHHSIAASLEFVGDGPDRGILGTVTYFVLIVVCPWRLTLII